MHKCPERSMKVMILGEYKHVDQDGEMVQTLDLGARRNVGR